MCRARLRLLPWYGIGCGSFIVSHSANGHRYQFTSGPASRKTVSKAETCGGNQWCQGQCQRSETGVSFRSGSRTGYGELIAGSSRLAMSHFPRRPAWPCPTSSGQRGPDNGVRFTSCGQRGQIHFVRSLDERRPHWLTAYEREFRRRPAQSASSLR